MDDVQKLIVNTIIFQRDRRAENWSFDDTRALFEAAVSRRHILKAQFGSKVKPADKDRAWDEIVGQCRACFITGDLRLYYLLPFFRPCLHGKIEGPLK